MFEVKKNFLNQILDNFANEQLLIEENEEWSFGKFIDESYLFSNLLNFKPLNHVPIFTTNHEFFLKIILALWFRRAIAVPLNPNFPLIKKKELLTKAGCDENSFQELLNVFNSQKIKCDQKSDDLSQNLKKRTEILDKKNISINPEAMGTITFTSGSSGSEKAVVHSIANHFFSALGANEFMPLKPGDRWLLSLPLYHVGGLAIFFRTLISGAAMVIPPENGILVETLKKFKITHISLVPTQLFRLLETKVGQDSLLKLKLILLGGSKIPMSLLQKSLKIGLKIKTTYGSTEMASQIATGKKCFYKILPYREVRISSEKEIEVRGRTRFLGYYDGTKLLKPFDKDGWFKTGDLGVWYKKKKKIGKNKDLIENYIKIFGRIDSMFVSGGENIYPEEIEELLFKSNMVEKAVVVPVNDLEYGERPVVFLKCSESFSESNIRDYLRNNLIRFKVPDLFLPWEETFEIDLKYRKKEMSKLAQTKFDLWQKKRKEIKL